MAREPAVLIYDGSCGLCLATRRILEPLDVFRAIRWVPYQSEEARRFGIPKEEMERSVQFLAGGRRRSGFDAARQVLLRLPPLYLGAAWLLAKKPSLALPLALFFSPLSRPAGEAVYRWVSEHRHSFLPNPCGFAPPQAGPPA